MRIIKAFVLCALLLKATGAMAYQVEVDWDRGANFDMYRTYMWAGPPQVAYPGMQDRIVKAVNAEMEAKGYHLVTSNADLAVSAKGNNGFVASEDFDAILGGGWGWYRYWYPQAYMPARETFGLGTLYVDLVDTHTNQIVWYASSTDVLYEEHCNKWARHLHTGLEKMFEHFPTRL
jgi:hypothetical protein